LRQRERKPVRMSEPVQVCRLKPNGAHGVIALPALQRFSDSPIFVAFGTRFLSLSGRMRLVAEILIIAALIFFGWNTPFKQYADRANRTITSTLDGMGGSLQKHQDKSVKRY